MKKIFIVTISFFFIVKSGNTQATTAYKYYFLEIRATGKAEVELTPEMQAKYDDIDTLIVSKREATKKGDIVTGKKYANYSDAFNALSKAGLEFVQFANLPTFGGATALFVNDLRINYVIWRKKIE